jgi:hypothetical protein
MSSKPCANWARIEFGTRASKVAENLCAYCYRQFVIDSSNAPRHCEARSAVAFPERAKRRVQSKVEEKPCQAKRERKTYALTFKLVKSEERSDVAIQAAVQFSGRTKQTERSSGLPRA